MGHPVLRVLLFFVLAIACQVYKKGSSLSMSTKQHSDDNTFKAGHSRDRLSIAAWNCRGIKGSMLYLEALMKRADILAVSEHKLGPIWARVRCSWLN